MMASRWIRLDTTWDLSEWVAALPAESQLAWIKLLCYAKASGIAGVVKAMSPAVAERVTGVTRDGFSAMLDAAQKHGALTVEDGNWTLTAWKKYQGDDTNAERQKRYRASKSRLSTSRVTGRYGRDVTDVTPTETETTTETVELHTHTARGNGNGFDPSDPFGGLDAITTASIRGLYGGEGRIGTDERAWGRVDSADERERILGIAVTRWRGEGGTFNGKFFRKILTTVIEEQTSTNGNGAHHEPVKLEGGGEWLNGVIR